MPIVDGWFDWASERVPGPADKVYSAPNFVLGVVPHSMVGYYPAWERRLMSQDRLESGRYTPYAAASIHGAVLLDGRLIQHYPLTASCWGSGSRFPNTHFVAFEFEGGAPGNVNEPYTTRQTSTLIRIIEETRQWRRGVTTHIWQPRRPVTASDVTASLYEHNECVRWGSRPTACPSNRVPWSFVLQKLEEDDDMAGATPEQVLVANLLMELAQQALAGIPLTPDQQAQFCFLADCKKE